MSVVQQKATECASCGGYIVKPIGEEFCSQDCFQSGRAFCKQCGKLLPPSKGRWKRTFCNELCEDRHSRSMFVNASLLEEWNRSTCKTCGKPITQNGKGTRQFCNNNGRCCARYHKTIRTHNFNPLEEWGNYPPETRKILRELQDMRMIATAKRLAVAIDREYVLRHQGNPENIRGGYIVCRCKTCGKEFKRRPWGGQSKDYCKRICRPASGHNRGEFHVSAKLTWEKVDEIRNLYASEHITQKTLGEKYDVCTGAIRAILQYKTWKPENDPRRKEQEAQ